MALQKVCYFKNMKYSFLLLLLLPIFSLCQSKYALVDKKLKQPILYTDSVSIEQISKGYFPIENNNIDSLIANLYYLRDMLSKLQRSKMQSFELHSSNTIIKTERQPYAYGDRYKSIFTSINGEIIATMLIVSSEIKNKDNLDRIRKLIAYLKSNQSFFKEPNEINPKIYNVVVITQ
jgi:hypothetical protein